MEAHKQALISVFIAEWGMMAVQKKGFNSGQHWSEQKRKF